jgi:hypothetical protein
MLSESFALTDMDRSAQLTENATMLKLLALAMPAGRMATEKAASSLRAREISLGQKVEIIVGRELQ